MTPEQVIRYFGSEVKVAAALSLTPQAVNFWKQRKKIPPRTQALIQLKTQGKLKAERGG